MQCKICKGEGHVTVKMRDLSGRNDNPLHPPGHVLGIVVCPGCNGKGHVTEEDRQRVVSVEFLEQIVS